MTVALIWLGLVAAMASSGMVVVRMIGALTDRPLDRLVVGAALGTTIWGWFGLGLAAAGGLRWEPIAVVAALALAVGGRDCLVTASRVMGRLPATTWGVLAVCGIMVATVVVSYGTPPVGGDQTKYQLAYPRFYAAAGGLVPSSSVWGQQQFLQNFVYAIGFAASGDVLARLFALTTAVLAALAFGGLVHRHLVPGVGPLAAGVYFTLPFVWSQMFRAGSDMALVLYAILAVTALLDWWEDGSDEALWRITLCCGSAGATKVMGLLIPTLVGCGVLWGLARWHAGWGTTIARALRFGLGVLAICAPFYLRNVADTGNPIFPFGHSVFGGKDWTEEATAYLDHYYEQYQSAWAVKRGGKPYHGIEVLRFPWDVTMYPESFELSARQTLDISPFMLAFLPAVLLVRGRRAAAWTVAAIGVTGMAVIAIAAWPHPRYVFPSVTLAFAAAMAGAAALLGPRLLPVVLAVSLLGNVALTSKLLRGLWVDQLRVALGQMPVATFMAKHSPRWAFWSAANPVVGPNGRVLVLEKIPHPYYIDTPFLMASHLEQGRIDYRRIESPAALAAIARELGMSHVAVDVDSLTAAGDPYEAHVGRLWSGLVQEECDKVLERAGFALYALRGAHVEVRTTEDRGG